MPDATRRGWIDRQLIAALKRPLQAGDSELRWILVGLLLGDLAAAAVVTWIGHGAFVVLIGAWVAVVALTPVIMRRVQRYSEAGLFWFLITLPVFLAWNWIVLWVVTLTGVGVGHPRLAWVVIEVVGALPLVFTITLLTHKLRGASGG